MLALLLSLVVLFVALEFLPERKKGEDEAEPFGPRSQKLLKFMIDVEGKKFSPYRDSAGHLTVGIGHKIKPSEMHYLNRNLTEGEILKLYYEDIEKFYPIIEGLPNLTENQKIALISWAFNVGFHGAKNSTLLQRLRKNDPKASEEFLRWVYITDPKTGKKTVSKGLTNRRNKEKNLFDKN